MKEYKTITEVSGPLVFAEVDEPVGYDEIVEIETPSGETKRGQVLETSDGRTRLDSGVRGNLGHRPKRVRPLHRRDAEDARD